MPALGGNVLASLVFLPSAKRITRVSRIHVLLSGSGSVERSGVKLDSTRSFVCENYWEFTQTGRDTRGEADDKGV